MPFGRGVEEGEVLTREEPRGTDEDAQIFDVEDQAGGAGVVDVEEVGVEV